MSSKETHRSGQIANRLDGKVAPITGGSRGIGAAIALRFAAEGALEEARLTKSFHPVPE